MTRLFVDGFRGIDGLTLEFAAPTTVLVGSNGSGKTSLVECAYLMLRETRRARGIRESGFQVSDVANWRWDLSCTLDCQIDGVDSHLELKADVDADRDAVISTVEFRGSESSGGEPSPPMVVFFNVDRARDQDFRRGQPEDRKPAPTLRPTHAAMGRSSFRLFLDWFQQREDLENQLLRDQPGYRDPVLEAIRRAVRSVAAHGLLGAVGDLRIERQPPLRMVLRKENQELVVDQLSHGEKSLLAMVGDLAFRLAFRNPEAADPLAAPGWVFIDEIELHLHPRWQRAVIPALEKTFPGCQFVVSTHSAQTLSEVPADSIRILTRDGHRVHVHVPVAAYGLDSNRILEDVLDAPSRPPEIQRELDAIYVNIGRGDLAAARERIAALQSRIGPSDPALTRAEALVHRRETLGR